VNLRDRLKRAKASPPPLPPLPKATKASPPPLPAAKPPPRPRRDVQEVIVGNEKPSTIAALDAAIVKLSNHLVQKVHLIVARSPISPLTWLQSQQLRSEIGFTMRLVAAAARWFEHHKRAERSVEVDGWDEDAITVKTTRPKP